MSSLWSKKPLNEKTTSSNDKTKVTFREKKTENIFGSSDQHYGLTLSQICKVFDHRKMSFLWSKKPPFKKTTLSNDKTEVTFREKKT